MIATAVSSVAVSPQQAGIAALMQSYSADMIGTDWWQAAVAQSTLETYEQATGDTTYYQDIAATYTAYKNAHFGNFTNDYADDTGWWGLAWLQAYNMTGNTAYLQTAGELALLRTRALLGNWRPTVGAEGAVVRAWAHRSDQCPQVQYICGRS